MRKEAIMKKYIALIILLGAMNITATDTSYKHQQTIASLIDTTFEACSLADIYTTLTSTRTQLLKTTPTSRSEVQLIREQENNIHQLITALDPFIIEPGIRNHQLQAALLRALHQERQELKNSNGAHIDELPWQTAARNITGFNQSLTSSAAWTENASATDRILVGAAGTALVGFGLYKLFTSSVGKSIGRMLIKPVQKIWQSTVKAINVIQTGGLKKLPALKTLAIDLLLQFIIMKGLSEAESLMAEDDRKAQQPVIDQFNELQKQLEKKQEELKKETEASTEKIADDYKKSVAALNVETTKVFESTQDEFSYILKLINIAQATDTFQLLNPITLDLLFAQSAMLTPKNASGTVWRNIWNDSNAYGNWLYDPNLNAFVQFGAPLGSLKKNITNYLQRQATSKKEFDQYSADYNQIFTEYFPADDTYDIDVDITLINAAFPFCCGIAFNKARWLAGSLDRDATYRFVGIVGTLSKDGKKTLQLDAPTKQLDIYAAQSTMDALGHMTSPMLQIFDISKNVQPLVSLKNDLADIGINPITYTIHITNHRDYIEVTIKNKDQKIYENKIVTLSNDTAMNKTLYWYHGIGFIAPRCQAVFSIKAPAELRYQDSDINAFRKG
jgi:hypothetical protein